METTAFYLASKKLNVRSGDTMVAIINEIDASENGIVISDKVSLEIPGREKELIVSLDTTNSLVSEGEIGLYEDVWEKYNLVEAEIVKIRLVPSSDAIASIRKKLLGKKLSYEEIYSIVNDIATDRLDRILTAYYASAGYSPGFDEEEMYYMTKAMAESGEVLHFNGIVADKHSIGGVAGKGITPLVIPIVAAHAPDVILPNTSTRAITSASATTDMLEVVMPMSFSKEELEAMILKNNAFMVWGGGLDLAPADDKIIQVQKPLGIESIDKFVSSIIAKKVAQGVNHVIFDVPVGKGAKIESEKEFLKVKNTFLRIGKKFNINIVVFRRNVTGIDGNAVGPTLECREFLRVFERDERRSLQLEEDALQIAGGLIELCGKANKQEGYEAAKKVLEDGSAFTKFKQIVASQGGNERLSSHYLEIGGITYEFYTTEDGVVENIYNKAVFEVCRSLGNPHIKEAGMFFHKKNGDTVKKGDKLITLYATTQNRMDLAKKVLQQVKIFEIVAGSKSTKEINQPVTKT